MTANNLDIKLVFSSPLEISEDQKNPDTISIEFQDGVFASNSGVPLEIDGDFEFIDYELPK